MATTSRGYPLIDSTFAPDVPNDMNALAAAINTDVTAALALVNTGVPVYQTGTPSHESGLLWFNPNTQKLQISDGSAWHDANPTMASTGTAPVGTSAATAPYQLKALHVSDTTDSGAFIDVPLPAGVTALHYADGVCAGGQNVGYFQYATSSLSAVKMQIRNASTGAQIVSTAVVFHGFAIVQL